MCPAGGIRRKKGICLEKKKEIDIDSILSKLKEEKSRGEIDQKPLSNSGITRSIFSMIMKRIFMSLTRVPIRMMTINIQEKTKNMM